MGLSPTSATAAMGSRPNSLAQRHTSPSIARLESARKAFSTQKEAGMPSGTNTNVNSVNRGPYGLSSWCQLLSA